MPSRIFRVDLSDASRDFRHTATEPGLGMLDETGANYTVMRQWLGDYAAEPNWERPDLVGFFVRREGERLVEYHAASVTGDELEKSLKEDFENLQTKLRKARPESSTEQSLHRVASKTLKTIANDPDANDCGCFLFKYRLGKEPWRLVWCWGFQRTDQHPAKPIICGDLNCQQLFVKRSGQKAACPACATVTRPVVGTRGGLYGRIGLGGFALALLLLLLLLFGQPKLNATPSTWSGPAGAVVDFQVVRKSWFFFKKDITDEILAHSYDNRVMEFRRGARAKANGVGQTTLTFRHGDRITDVVVRVSAGQPPKSLEIEPTSVLLGIGTTAPLKVTGVTEDKSRIDMSDSVEFKFSQEEIALLHDQRLEGGQVGKVTLTASYRADPFSDPVEVTAEVEVRDLKFATLEVAIAPSDLKRSQQADLKMDAVAEDGGRFSVLGSTRLVSVVQPPDIAELSSDRLLALRAGSGELKASFFELDASAGFTVDARSVLPSGTFEVTPKDLELTVYEYYRMNVLTDGQEPIVGSSSDSGVVEVLDDQYLVGRSPGSALITFKQGGRSQAVTVKVTGAELVEMWSDPDHITMKPGQRRLVRILARTAEGKQIELAPSQLTWESQPLAEYVEFDRSSLYLTARTPTPRPQRLAARVGELLVADALVEVVGERGALLVVGDDPDFLPYPPITRHDLNVGSYVGRGLVFRGSLPVVGDGLAADHIFSRSGLRSGTIIRGVNDVRFDTMTADQIRRYFLENPIDENDVLLLKNLDGSAGQMVLGEMGQLIEPVKIASATYHSQGPKIFAKVRLAVTEPGSYRVLVPGIPPKDDWLICGSGVSETIVTESFDKPGERDFELIVERKIGDEVKRFPKNLTLPEDSEIK